MVLTQITASAKNSRDYVLHVICNCVYCYERKFINNYILAVNKSSLNQRSVSVMSDLVLNYLFVCPFNYICGCYVQEMISNVNFGTLVQYVSLDPS